MKTAYLKRLKTPLEITLICPSLYEISVLGFRSTLISMCGELRAYHREVTVLINRRLKLPMYFSSYFWILLFHLRAEAFFSDMLYNTCASLDATKKSRDFVNKIIVCHPFPFSPIN